MFSVISFSIAVTNKIYEMEFKICVPNDCWFCWICIGLRLDRAFLFLAEVWMKNRLRELRAAKEWSQSDLAEKLEVSRQTINAIETEKYDPSLPLAFKVARLFKLKIEDVFEAE